MWHGVHTTKSDIARLQNSSRRLCSEYVWTCSLPILLPVFLVCSDVFSANFTTDHRPCTRRRIRTGRNLSHRICQWRGMVMIRSFCVLFGCMYVYMYICIIYIYIFIHVCIYICIYIYIYVYINMYISFANEEVWWWSDHAVFCADVCMYICICIYICVCVCVCIYMYMYIYIYVCICICIYICIYIYVYTHTHTHTHVCIWIYAHIYTYTYMCMNVYQWRARLLYRAPLSGASGRQYRSERIEGQKR